jgi:hypothetical protein
MMSEVLNFLWSQDAFFVFAVLGIEPRTSGALLLEPHPQPCFVLETGSWSCLCLCHPKTHDFPASTSPAAVITGMHHHTLWSQYFFYLLKIIIEELGV